MPAPDAAWLEKLRQSGIRVDREGRFIHEGRRGPSRGPEGRPLSLARSTGARRPCRARARYVLRLDERRFAYLDVDDTPLVARAARVDGDTIYLSLSDGSEEPLAPATLTVDDEGVLRALVRGGRLEARLATSAVSALGDLLGEAEGQATLTLAGRRYPLAAPRGA